MSVSLRITWNNKMNLNLNQSYINVWNQNHTPPRFRIPLITIPIQYDSDWDSTIDINQKRFRFQLSLESESESFFDSDSRVWIAPVLNHFPVIIMLVCKINIFFKSDKHNSVVYLLSYFYVKNFVSQGTKKLLGNWNVLLIVLKYILKVLGMYLSTFPQKGMYLYLSTFVVQSTCTCNLSTFKVLLPSSALIPSPWLVSVTAIIQP